MTVGFRDLQPKATSEQIRQYSVKSPSKWLFWVLWDWGVILSALWAAKASGQWPIYFLSLIIIGTRQHALAILAHDGAHGLICKSKTLNDILVSVFCFLPLFNTPHSYRIFHIQHHNHLGTELDPELIAKKRMKGAWDVPVKKHTLLGYFLKDIVGLGIPECLQVISTLRPTRKIDNLIIGLFWIPVASALWFTGNVWVLGMWITALLTSYWAAFRLRTWSEHINTPGTHRIQVQWWQRWLFLPHNTWCHFEHHKWPPIPFYNLIKARNLEIQTAVLSLNAVFDSFTKPKAVPFGTVFSNEIPPSGSV